MPSNAELLCGFMEKRPEMGPLDFRPWRSNSPARWWVAANPTTEDNSPNEWRPVSLCLNRLREIEAKLTEEQWQRYYDGIWVEWQVVTQTTGRMRLLGMFLLHASVEQKIAALAQGLRPEVEKLSGEKGGDHAE